MTEDVWLTLSTVLLSLRFLLGEGTVLVLTSFSVRALCLSLNFERTQLLSFLWFMIRSTKSTFTYVSVLNPSVGLPTFLSIKFTR